MLALLHTIPSTNYELSMSLKYEFQNFYCSISNKHESNYFVTNINREGLTTKYQASLNNILILKLVFLICSFVSGKIKEQVLVRRACLLAAPPGGAIAAYVHPLVSSSPVKSTLGTYVALASISCVNGRNVM